MLFVFLRLLLAIFLAVEPLAVALAQSRPASQADTLYKYEASAPTTEHPAKAWYQKKLVRASIVPLALIGCGVASVGNYTYVGDYPMRHTIQENAPGFRTHIDDYLQYAPYLELGATALFGVQSRDNRVNTLLIIAKSELLMCATVTAVKYSTRVWRPDGSTRNSFPSGHTAQAFLAASIVHTELRHKSQWYGVGAYAVATSVGALRMLNNRHWESDVLAGAGFGILSAHLAYLTHRNHSGNKPSLLAGVNAAPTWQPGGGTGVCLSWQPR